MHELIYVGDINVVVFIGTSDSAECGFPLLQARHRRRWRNWYICTLDFLYLFGVWLPVKFGNGKRIRWKILESYVFRHYFLFVSRGFRLLLRFLGNQTEL